MLPIAVITTCMLGCDMIEEKLKSGTLAGYAMCVSQADNLEEYSPLRFSIQRACAEKHSRKVAGSESISAKGGHRYSTNDNIADRFKLTVTNNSEDIVITSMKIIISTPGSRESELEKSLKRMNTESHFIRGWIDPGIDREFEIDVEYPVKRGQLVKGEWSFSYDDLQGIRY